VSKKGAIILLAAIVAFLIAEAVVFVVLISRAQITAFLTPPQTPAIDTSGWQTYTSSAFGFSFKYPPSWQKSGDSLTVADPHIFFGNPLNGTTTYRLNVFVYANPNSLSPSDYVSALLASDTAMDAASGAASGTAPMMAPQFSSRFALTVNGLPAYELDDVFEFDHGAEDIYVQDGTSTLLFDFPVADLNPNIVDPTDNNAVVHAIINTLMVK
jgi:hypothetical protein